VALDPNVVERSVDFGCSGVVFHIPEMAVALLIVTMDVGKVIFWEFENNGKENQKFRNDLIIDVSTKFFNLLPVLFD
jgi:hypothetical protein